MYTLVVFLAFCPVAQDCPKERVAVVEKLESYMRCIELGVEVLKGVDGWKREKIVKDLSISCTSVEDR